MPPNSQPNEDRFRKVWDGDSETDCVEACRDLQRAGIKYEVSQLPVGLSGRMGVDWRFEVYVLSTDYERARAALGFGGEHDEPADEALEIPADSGPVDPIDDSKKTAAYLKRWRPEEAVVEVGSQGASDESSIVEMSLRENLIHYRVERSKAGARRYFVHPSDETRAREIFREIKTGNPPA